MNFENERNFVKAYEKGTVMRLEKSAEDRMDPCGRLISEPDKATRGEKSS